MYNYYEYRYNWSKQHLTAKVCVCVCVCVWQRSVCGEGGVWGELIANSEYLTTCRLKSSIRVWVCRWEIREGGGGGGGYWHFQPVWFICIMLDIYISFSTVWDCSVHSDLFMDRMQRLSVQTPRFMCALIFVHNSSIMCSCVAWFLCIILA